MPRILGYSTVFFCDGAQKVSASHNGESIRTSHPSGKESITNTNLARPPRKYTYAYKAPENENKLWGARESRTGLFTALFIVEMTQLASRKRTGRTASSAPRRDVASFVWRCSPSGGGFIYYSDGESNSFLPLLARRIVTVPLSDHSIGPSCRTKREWASASPLYTRRPKDSVPYCVYGREY